MDWPTLDTRWWNLSLGVVATAAMTACGPTILLDDDDSITDSDTDGPETTPPPDTTEPPPPGECLSDANCNPGEVCIDNVCVYEEYYCQDGGCCYDYGDCCYGDCCYEYGDDCYNYEECFDDIECGPGQLCVYYDCQEVEQLPECDEPNFVPLPVPEDSDEPIISLSFVDGNGDEADDLLVARETHAQLYFGTGDAPVDLPIPDGEVVADAVAGDFNGDAVGDIAFTDGVDSVTILLGDGVGGFSVGSTTEVGTAITELVALQWDSDGALDLAGLTSLDTAVLQQGDGAGGLMASVTLHGDGDNHTLAAGDFNGDAYGDLVAQDSNETMLFFGNDEADVSIDGDLSGYGWMVPWQRQLMAGKIDGSGQSEIVGHTNKESWEDTWLLLETWRESGEIYYPYAIMRYAEHGAMGDYDGDGVNDVVLAGGDLVMLVRGLAQGGVSPVLDCQTEFATGLAAERLAVGDFDGDGRADIAISNDNTLVVFSNE